MADAKRPARKKKRPISGGAIPQITCECGYAGRVGIVKHRIECPRCGETQVHLFRENVPYGVWLTLADNEDEHGRVPSHPDWQPRKLITDSEKENACPPLLGETSSAASSAATSRSTTPSRRRRQRVA
jgi:hypothetical protein